MQPRAMVRALALLSSGFAAGCLAPAGERVWGEEVQYLPAGQRWAEGARAAAVDPWTWGPLIGLAIFAWGDLDQEVSDWAREETPVFGSETNADRWSDDLRASLRLAQYGSTLLAPAGPEASDWWRSKIEGLVLTSLVTEVNRAVTSGGKRVSDRERPDGRDRESFPSGHTSGSFASAAWTLGVLPVFELAPSYDRGARAVVRTVAMGTGWARVEAGRHFPSDIFAGAALGNFLVIWLQGSFLNEGPVRLQAYVDPGFDTVLLGLRWSR